MPRPLPPGVGGEGFERLLAELSAEFERLRQRNAGLSRENLQLRAGSAGGDGWELEAAPLEGGELEEALVKDAAEQPSAWRVETEHAPQPAEVITLAQFHLEVSSEAKWCSEKSGPTALQEALVKEAAEQPSAWRVETEHAPKPAMVVTLAQFHSEVNSEAKWCSEKSGLTALQDQFRRLDVSGLGRLEVDDLVRILIKHGANVEPETLIDTVRVVTNPGPLDHDLDGTNPDARATVSVDFPAFKRLLMDRGLAADVEHFGGPNVEKCFKSLRHALREEATTPPTKLRLQLPKKDPSNLSQEMHTVTRKWLDTLPVAVILVNTLVTGLSTDYQEHDEVWDVFEYFFVAFYFLEFATKIALFGCSGYFNGPERWWNMFDFVCLIISLGDTAVKVWLAVFVHDGSNTDLSALMLIKIFRLARLARLVRTLRFKIFYELKLMILGVFSGLRVLTWAIALLTVLTYLVGVAMASMLSKDEPEFGSVLSAMFTLFRCWTEGCAAYDGTPLAERLRKQYGIAFMIFHILVTMFVTVGVFNLIMAIFIDNVVTSQIMRKHKEMGEKTSEIEMKFKRLFTGFVKDGANLNSNVRMSLFERAKKELTNLGKEDQQTKAFGKGWSSVEAEWDHLRDMNVTITREVFQEWLKDEAFQRLLDEAEIESANQSELFDVLDADMGGELSMDELTTGLMKLRGPVIKADIVAVRLKVRHLTRLLEDLPLAAPPPAEPGAEPGAEP